MVVNGSFGMPIVDITSEPPADGEYEMRFLAQDLAGNVSTSDPRDIWIDTVEPNTPYPIVGDFDGDGLDDLATWPQD